jgi:RHS repeat-associated protein
MLSDILARLRLAIPTIAVAVAAAGAARAQSVNLSYLEAKDPVAPDAIAPHGTDLFGDRINLFNGSFEFEHTDLSLPGNSQLPVALLRHHSPGQHYDVRGQFGDWDLNVPWIGGSFSSRYGWVTSTNGTTDRCTRFVVPPAVQTSTGGNNPPPTPGPPTNPQSATPLGVGPGTTNVSINGTEYWRRTSLNVPGHGVQEVLKRAVGYSGAPSDGRAYQLVTRNNWQITCLSTIQNGAGEGFLAVSPEGVRYRFDWMATRGQTGVKKTGAEISRLDYFLMATRVEDRFGNWVAYTFDAAQPLLLKRIESNDGRVISITNSGGRAASATDGTRTIRYDYGGQNNLTSVALPDGSRWSFNLAPLYPPEFEQLGEGANCDFPGNARSGTLTGTITHPSGATASFSTRAVMFGRTYVDKYCKYVPNSTTVTYGAAFPKNIFNDQTLVSKEISGPGMATLRWSYAYYAPSGWSTCTSGACLVDWRSATVTEPNGQLTRHVFGNRWRVNEGQLLQVDEGWDANSGTAVRTTTYTYRTASGQSFPDQFGYSLVDNNDYLSSRNRPQQRRQITQQGTTFTWEVDASAAGFDGLARPRLVRKYSSLGHSRQEETAYFDQTASWVLGQVASVTERPSGIQIERHVYDPTTALETQTFSFGLETSSFAYHPDGTVATVRDAARRETLLRQYKRGRPQSVQYPDTTGESQVVNNLGKPDSRTNGAGTMTSYEYDLMGRVRRITYPAGDSAAYSPTEQTFEQIASHEYGLPPGHWRQTISTDNRRTVRYFDAMWRPRLELRYDASQPNTTASYQETRYDLAGNKAFESYPERSFSAVDADRSGVSTSYDAIHRAIQSRASSEIGTLQTDTVYPPSVFQRQVTNPRRYTTTYTFQAFDSPSYDSITGITAPEKVSVSILRDNFGKAKSITRSGVGASVTRSYVYDGFHRLCKSIEPETGSTVVQYDSANNVAWRASGLTLPSLSCEQSSVPANRMVSYTYDALNRLKNTTYGDGSPGVSRTYTADGLPETINTPHFAWTLGYNNRRMLTSEKLYAWWGSSYTVSYGIDSQGNTAWMTYPGGPTVYYSPDALGRPTQVSGYVSDILHHPNGALASYRAANGITFNMSQNVRGLPSVWQHTGVAKDEYSYDANGNVSSIVDRQEGGSTSRSMGYDGLDRLTVANGLWGSGRYSYDALDNLTSSVVGARSVVHAIEAATNRVSALTGSVNLGLHYDANGNIVGRGSQGFQFDIGNRMSAAIGKATYVYDGHGRRAWTQAASGRTKFRLYDQSGRLVFTYDSAEGEIAHVGLGNTVVAERSAKYGTRFLHADALGSRIATTAPNATLIDRTRYEPYGGTAAGTNPDGIGFTGHVNDADTGLVYMQQRYYDPIAGRFLSVDPVTTDSNTGKDFGRYTYVDNNPYSKVDPDGRQGVGPTNLFPNFDPRRYLKDVAVEAAKFVGMASAGAGGAAVTGLKGVAVAVKAAEAAGGAAKLGEAAGVGGAAQKGVNTWWVGADGRAAAAASGGTTLAPSQGALSAAAAGNIKAVAAESAAAAKAATGPQKVFIGEGSGKVFYQEELPNLLQNIDKGKVPSIEINF